MVVTPPLRYIHIDDYGPVGIDNGPDDAAFALARADLAASGYHMLVIGPKQYWLQNGFYLNAYTDANNVQYPALPNILITSDSSLGVLTTLETTGPYPVFSGLPATIVLSPGYADPSIMGRSSAYTGGAEPCRTTGSIQLTDSCSISNLRIISWAAYQVSRAIAQGIDTASLVNSLVWGLQGSMATPVGAANGVAGVSAGGGTAVQFDGSYCTADKLLVLGFRNGVVSVPLFNSSSGSGASPTFGTIQGDTPNLIRIDMCNDIGTITGPIRQENSLTAGLVYALSSVTGTTDGFGGTDLLWAVGSNFGPLGVPPAVGDEISITAAVTATGGPLYNAANIGELNPAGNVTNRYTGVVVGSGASGTLNLPGIPIGSFFDASSAAGAVVVGTSSGTTLTITAVESGVPAVGQWLTSSQVSISTPTSITRAFPISLGDTVVCYLSSSLTVSSATTFTLLAGASATASITGSTLVASNVLGGTLATGQLISGAGVAPGTTITGSLSSNTYTVNSPVLTDSSVFTAFNGAAFSGSISLATLTILSTPLPTLTMGEFLFGAGISSGTTIAGPASGSTYPISTSYGTIQAENMTAASGETLVGTITGTLATFTAAGGSSGQLLLSSNTALLPNTYAHIISGTSGTVNVFQAVGSAPFSNGNPAESVAMTAVSTSGTNAAVFGGYITAGSPTSTLNIVSIAAGASTLTTGQTLLGAGIPSSVFVTNTLGAYSISESLTVGSASNPVTVRGGAKVGHWSGGVMLLRAA